MVKKHDKKKKITLILLVIIVLVAVTIVGYLWFTSRTNEPKHIATPEEKVSEIVQGVETGKDPKVAQSELQQLADKEPDTSKKVVYLYGAADLSMNSSDFKSALKINENIEALEQSALSAGNIAQAYYDMGDYRNAVKYYDIAISRSEKPASETERAPYNDYTILKREAEAKVK